MFDFTLDGQEPPPAWARRASSRRAAMSNRVAFDIITPIDAIAYILSLYLYWRPRSVSLITSWYARQTNRRQTGIITISGDETE